MPNTEYVNTQIFPIESTFPSKLGDIVDTTGLPLGEVDLPESRLKNIIETIFNKKKLNKGYWETLKAMISKPNEVFKLVAIDGFRNDVSGQDDIALVFYMGKPRLRGRKINYLEKTYARISSRNNGDILSFWNSYLDDENSDIPHFTFASKTPVFHPHCSGGDPCLGSFSGDLSQYKRDGHPIMYLQTVYQFINTWNVRSPFWNLNHMKIKNVSDDSQKRYHTSTFKSITSYMAIESIERKLQVFVNKYLSKIHSPTIANDITCLSAIYQLLEVVKVRLTSSVRSSIPKDSLRYLVDHSNEIEDRRSRSVNLSNYHFSIMPSTRIRNNWKEILIPVRSERGVDQTILIHSTIHAKNKWSKEYNLDLKILDGLSNVMCFFYNWLNTDEILNQLFENNDYAIRLYAKYLAPLDTKRQNLFDEMSNSGLYPHRITKMSNDKIIFDGKKGNEEKQISRFRVEKDKLEKKDHKRYERINNMCLSYYGKSLTDDFIQKCCSEELAKCFGYKLKRNLYDDGYNIVNQGKFWNSLGYYNAEEEFEEMLERVNELGEINSIETLIDSYELVKERTVSLEAGALINDYERVIRRLKEYGNQIEDTNKDTQQVHLSFK